MTREQKRLAIIAACSALAEALCTVLADGAAPEGTPARRASRKVTPRPLKPVNDLDVAEARTIARRKGWVTR